MQREIKFRIWDNIDKKFQFINTQSQTIEIIGFHFYPNRSVVQQFTGLKDKSGKEIYEGDILKCRIKEKWTSEEETEYLHIVEHKIIESGESHISGFVYIPMDREIVGNIFENPELLK